MPGLAHRIRARPPKPQRRCPTGPRAGRARIRAGRTWSPSRASARAVAALPESEEMKTRWPEPRSRIGREQRPGQPDRRLEIDPQGAARSAPGEKLSSRPEAGQTRRWRRGRRPRRPRRRGARAAPSSARSATSERWPSPGSEAASRSSSSALARAEHEAARRARRARRRDRPPEAAGRPGRAATVLPAQLHEPQRTNPARLRRREALRLLGHLPDHRARAATRAHNAHRALRDAGHDPRWSRCTGSASAPVSST